MTSAKELKERRQRDDDHSKLTRCLVPNGAARAARILVRPVYPSDPAWARRALEVLGNELEISMYVEPSEAAEAVEILKRHGVTNVRRH